MVVAFTSPCNVRHVLNLAPRRSNFIDLDALIASLLLMLVRRSVSEGGRRGSITRCEHTTAKTVHDRNSSKKSLQGCPRATANAKDDNALQYRTRMIYALADTVPLGTDYLQDGTLALS